MLSDAKALRASLEFPLGELIEAVREIVREELARLERRRGWLDVTAAAEYLSLTPAALRTLVARDGIPFAKAPNGRLLFDPDALDAWVVTEAA